MSTRSESHPRPTAIPRPICATSKECVSRVRGVSLSRGPTTWVLSARRRSAVEHSRAVTREVGAVLGVGTGQRSQLRRLDHPAFTVVRVVHVMLIPGHRHHSLPAPFPGTEPTTLASMRVARLLCVCLAVL